MVRLEGLNPRPQLEVRCLSSRLQARKGKNGAGDNEPTRLA